ncbi:MAG: hypothetical protein H0U73_08680 [Tatlockia sp.]|nr:hypothetical protein [Tatlockia sp.]
MLKIAIYLQRNLNRFDIYKFDERTGHMSPYYDERFPSLLKFNQVRTLKEALEALESLNNSNSKKVIKNPDFRSFDNYGFGSLYPNSHEVYEVKGIGDAQEYELSLLHCKTYKDRASYLSIEHMIYLLKTKSTPVLPFFRALNPSSPLSGINNVHRENSEIIDKSVSEKIKEAFFTNHSFLGGLCATYDILMGNHYKVDAEIYGGKGSKGLLDYLIFPLVSRKLYSYYQQDINFAAALSLLIVVPLEIIRMTVGLALTLVLSLAVFLVQLLSPLVINNEELEAPGDDECCLGACWAAGGW